MHSSFLGLERLQDAILALRYATKDGQPEAAYTLGMLLHSAGQYERSLLIILSLINSFSSNILAREFYDVAVEAGHAGAAMQLLVLMADAYSIKRAREMSGLGAQEVLFSLLLFSLLSLFSFLSSSC